MKLALANVSTLKLPKETKEVLFFDEDIPGFGSRVHSFEYWIGKKQRRMTFGSYPAINLRPRGRRPASFRPRCGLAPVAHTELRLGGPIDELGSRNHDPVRVRLCGRAPEAC
jgi:hypothetical protein